MSWKADVLMVGALAVGGFVVFKNLGAISSWAGSQISSALSSTKTFTQAELTASGQFAQTPTGGQFGQGSSTTTGPSGVNITLQGGGIITLPNGQTISSSSLITNTGGNQQGSSAANSTPVNQTVPGTVANISGTASQYNPALPAAVAWAQPGSAAWNAYYGK
jgi:hypothetical protein